jgi:outer membrane protein TolC
MSEPNSFPIDLPTALRLADANNLLVAFAREQVSLAQARVDASEALWLPSIQGGGSYNRHEGAIQRIEGMQIQTSRGGFNAGLGAGAYGTTTPQVQGLYANFALADALFQPLAARRFADSRNRAASAATNDTWLQVALGYFELLRAGEDLAISRSIENDAQQLVRVTTAYAETGQGLVSDANRARTELAVRMNDVRRSREAQRVGSARLAQILRLDPTVELQPADQVAAPLELVPHDAPAKELVIQGLSTRPELAENRDLVEEASVRLRREQMAMLVPSIILGGSYMGLGSGINERMAPFNDRFDFDALAYWQVRNFGFGEAAARRGAEAAVRSARWKQLAMLDQVAREVVEAHAQVQMRFGQIGVARWGVEVALASHHQNLDRIEQAKGLPIESLQAIQALAQARREYLRAIIDYNSAQFALYRAIGWPVKDPIAMVPADGREP